MGGVPRKLAWLLALGVGAAPGVLLAAGRAAPRLGTAVDRVVAVVDKQVITLSELLVETRVALVYKAGETAAAADLDDDLLKTFTDYVVNQTLVSLQARRLGATEVSQAEIDSELLRFSLQFRSNDSYRAFLRRFDITEEALRRLAQRNLRNDKYMQERLRLRLGDSGEGVDSPRYQEALRKWLGELRQSAEVRLLGPTGELELLDSDSSVHEAPVQQGKP